MEISVDSTACSQFCDQVSCFVWRSLQTVLPAVNFVFRSAVLYGDLFRQYCLQSVLCLGRLFCMEISVDSTACSQFCDQVICFVWRSLQTVPPAVKSVVRSAVCMEISVDTTACSQFCDYISCFVWRSLQIVLPAVNSVIRSAVLYRDLCRQYCLQSNL